MDLKNLLTFEWDKSIIESWLKEDIPSFDYGGFVVGDDPKEAILYLKEDGVIAGVPFFNEIFHFVGCKIQWKYPEGTFLSAKNGRIEVAIVTGPARNLLVGERTALNMISRCSGIATKARRLSDLKQSKGFTGVIAGTRKTTPGFRLIEKYGLLVGGCDTHRMDLSSMIMIKDNHIWASGSIKAAVHNAKKVGGFSLKIEVECQSQEEAETAIESGADIVMLDNMKPEIIKKVAQNLKSKYSHILIEGSGGITEDTVAQYFDPNIDILSLGCLTQGVKHIDFSLKIKH